VLSVVTACAIVAAPSSCGVMAPGFNERPRAGLADDPAHPRDVPYLLLVGLGALAIGPS